nr:hypothetical protein B0A51_03424 [Rachicladosporium sp. CCFEE 5018]
MSASISSDCNEVKERYDSCFLKWYSEKFLRGTAKEDECEPLFKQYKTCITKALKDRGIDTMIEEARADNKENDMEFMKVARFAKKTRAYYAITRRLSRGREINSIQHPRTTSRARHDHRTEADDALSAAGEGTGRTLPMSTADPAASDGSRHSADSVFDEDLHSDNLRDCMRSRPQSRYLRIY